MQGILTETTNDSVTGFVAIPSIIFFPSQRNTAVILNLLILLGLSSKNFTSSNSLQFLNIKNVIITQRHNNKFDFPVWLAPRMVLSIYPNNGWNNSWQYSFQGYFRYKSYHILFLLESIGKRGEKNTWPPGADLTLGPLACMMGTSQYLQTKLVALTSLSVVTDRLKLLPNHF